MQLLTSEAFFEGYGDIEPLEDNHGQKVGTILDTHTIIDEWTVMVESTDASITEPAMLGPNWPDNLKL